MELIGLLIFIGKLLLLMLAVGIPLLLLIIFISNKIHRKIEPRYEELREKRIKELQSKDREKKKK